MALLYNFCLTLLPELLLAGVALSLWRQSKPLSRTELYNRVGLGFVLSGVGLYISFLSQFPSVGKVTVFAKPLATTKMATLLLCCGGAVCLLSARYFRARDQLSPKTFAILLFATSATMLTVSAQDLITVLLSLELTCFLVFLVANQTASAEKPLSPLLHHAIAGIPGTALLLGGLAFLLQATNTLGLESLAQASRRGAIFHPAFGWGTALLFLGLAAKAAAVPLRLGSSRKSNTTTPGVMFLTISFPLVVLFVFSQWVSSLMPVGSLLGQNSLVFAVSGAMLIWGALKSLAQASVPRMLLHASLVHIGITFLAVLARQPSSNNTLFVYLLSFAIAMVGCFTVLIVFEEAEGKHLELQNLSGLFHRYPILSACLTLFLLSLASFPPTLGFLSKLSVWNSALQSGQFPLLILLMLSFIASMVVMYAYLRVVIVLWMHSEAPQTTATDRPFPVELRLAVGLSAAIVLLGFFPPLDSPPPLATKQIQPKTPPRPGTEKYQGHEVAPEPIGTADAGTESVSDEPSTSQPATRPTSRPTNDWEQQKPAPSLSPLTNPTSKPATRPATRPSSRPTTKPEPSSHPTTHPVE